MKKLSSACKAGLIAFCVFVQAQAQTPIAGFTPGSFGVSESGAATYRIPLRVPPGIAGMEPKLALVYSSQAGNGLLGMGWNIEGLSAITRCPQTLAQDGNRGGVKYDVNDRFCLDGQRLIITSGSPYGAASTEYHTERDGFAWIKASTGTRTYPSTGKMPQSFTVKTKAGLTMEYGVTADSKIDVPGQSPTVRLWALDKITDANNNALTVTYFEDGTTKEFRPLKITYATSAAFPLGSSVQFVYETRSDITPLYQAGAAIQMTKRLTNVQSYVGTSLVSDYRLTYETSGATGRSRLNSIQECDVAGNCFAATTFQWQAAADGTFSLANTVTPYEAWTNATPGDFNGDGKTDYLINTQTLGAGWQVYLSNGDGTFTLAGSVTPYPSWNGLATGDFNGDGKTDFIINTTTAGVGWQVYLSNGDGSFTLAGSLSPYPEWTNAVVGDFNGDGKADILINTQTAGSGWYVYLSNGNGSFTLSGSLSSYAEWTSPVIGDFNGDGKADILINTQTAGAGWYTYLSNGDGTFTLVGSATPYPQWNGVATGDFNGDGLTDFLINTTTAGVGWNVYFSNGDGTFTYKGSVTPFPEWTSAAPGDFNGDGKTDFLINTNTAGAGWYIYQSNGDGSFTNTGALSPYTAWNSPATGDFNGDGKSDVLINTATAGAGWYLYVANTANAPIPDLVGTITTGLGANQSITYAPLTNSSGAVYTKDSSAVYPQMDLQIPLHVTSSATLAGSGTTLTTNYAYGGLKASLDGRGMLGFRWRSATDPVTGIVTRSDSRQDWPYVGLPSSVKQSSGSLVVSQTTNTLSCTNPPSTTAPCTVAPGNVYFPYISQSVQTGHELTGSTLPTVTTTNAFDGYGNATSVVIATVGGGNTFTKTTSNTFTNDISNWFLGRLTRSAVQSDVSP